MFATCHAKPIGLEEQGYCSLDVYGLESIRPLTYTNTDGRK